MLKEIQESWYFSFHDVQKVGVLLPIDDGYFDDAVAVFFCFHLDEVVFVVGTHDQFREVGDFPRLASFFLKWDCVPVELFVSAWFVKKDGGRELKRHDFERILGEENGALIYYNKFSELGYKVALEDRFLFKEIAEVTVSLKNPKGKAREDENWRHLKADARKTFE